MAFSLDQYDARDRHAPETASPLKLLPDFMNLSGVTVSAWFRKPFGSISLVTAAVVIIPSC